ncbi:hypothetical protein D3C72_2178730 [compost metagenome]
MFVGVAGTSVGRRRAGAGNRSKVEVGGGIYGVARPYFCLVLVEDDPFAVANAVGAGEDLIMAVRTVQREGRLGRGPVLAAW